MFEKGIQFKSFEAVATCACDGHAMEDAGVHKAPPRLEVGSLKGRSLKG